MLCFLYAKDFRESADLSLLPIKLEWLSALSKFRSAVCTTTFSVPARRDFFLPKTVGVTASVIYLERSLLYEVLSILLMVELLLWRKAPMPFIFGSIIFLNSSSLLCFKAIDVPLLCGVFLDRLLLFRFIFVSSVMSNTLSDARPIKELSKSSISIDACWSLNSWDLLSRLLSSSYSSRFKCYLISSIVGVEKRSSR